MRAVQVVPRISNEASGPSYSVVRLADELAAKGVKSSLVVLRGRESALSTGACIHSFPELRRNSRLGRSHQMWLWLAREVESGRIDVLHNHSLWMMPNVYAGWAIKGTDIPYVVSPRGTLSPWALNRSKWVKALFWRLLQEKSIRMANCFHATAESEYLDIRKAGFRQPVCVIPNGVDIPPIESSPGNSSKKLRRVLFLGRIHPVKGVDRLLYAWNALAPRHLDWELHIVGPDNVGYLAEMRTLAEKLKLDRVRFRGPLYGLEKQQAYQESELYILPSHSENFGMTVAESLAAGTPVIVTKGAPWSGVVDANAGWWVDNEIEALVAALESALAKNPEELAAMGCAGRRWMQAEFSWDRVGERMFKTYEWLRNGGSKPAWVYE